MITGANSGLGPFPVRALAEEGATALMACVAPAAVVSMPLRYSCPRLAEASSWYRWIWPIWSV